MERYSFIYGLVSSIDTKVWYVGKTNNPYKRLHSHLNYPKGKLTKWIAEQSRAGAVVRMIILDVCPYSKWKALETQRIAEYRIINPSLLNVSDGGEAYHCPPPTNEMLREWALRRWERERGRLKVCPICNKTFRVNSMKRVFCSDKCRQKAHRHRSQNISYSSALPAKLANNFCPICGQLYIPMDIQQMYCSRQCKREKRIKGATT